jgi:hypothetical protein
MVILIPEHLRETAVIPIQEYLGEIVDIRTQEQQSLIQDIISQQLDLKQAILSHEVQRKDQLTISQRAPIASLLGINLGEHTLLQKEVLSQVIVSLQGVIIVGKVRLALLGVEVPELDQHQVELEKDKNN